MMIAVASDDGVNVAGHTGRCAGFVMFEVADGTATRREYRTNSFTGHARGECEGEHHHDHGSGHHSHASLLDALGDCRAVVSRGMGPRLVLDLAAQGIDAYVTPVESAEAAADQFATGKLPRVTKARTCPNS